MTYKQDPGGNFASDVHRRVLAHLPLPDEGSMDINTFVARISTDTETDFAHSEEVLEVLRSLQESQYAVEDETGWKQTEQGFQTLTGPIASEVTENGE